MQRNIYFGFAYELSGLPDGEIELDWTVVHPEMTKPDGTTSTGYTYIKPATVEDGLAGGVSGYMLNRDYELVPGQWIFSYSYEGQVLVKKDFTVYLPETADR